MVILLNKLFDLVSSSFGPSSCSSSDNSYDFVCKEKKKLDTNKPLFLGARISLKSFISIFIGLVDKFNLPVSHREVLLNAIRSIFLPAENEVPLSYYRLKNTIELPEIRAFFLCKICESPIQKSGPNKNKCKNRFCQANICGLKKRSFVSVISSDIIWQLKNIISSNLDSIKKYKGI